MNPESGPEQRPDVDYFGGIHRFVTGKEYKQAQAERGTFVETLTSQIISDLKDPAKAEAARAALKKLIDQLYVGRME